MSNNMGPVCHIPPTNTPGNPQPQNLPGMPGPVSPTPTGNAAQDGFNQAIAALLNAMRLLLMQLANQGRQGQQGQQGFNRKPDPSKPPSWTEQTRVTDKVKVYQNNDKSSPNWVEVEQINQLTMVDKATGNTWKWSR